jgi:integrase
MFSKDFEKHLIASYLKHHLRVLEAKATGSTSHCENPDNVKAKLKKEDVFFDACAEDYGLSPDELIQFRQEFYKIMSVKMAAMIAKRDASEWPIHGKFSQLSKADRKALEIKILNVNKQLFEAECSMYEGDWGPMERLREKAERDLSAPYHPFEEVIAKYQEWYVSSKTTVKAGTKADMEVECRVLLEILGNISIAEVNSMDAVTKLKQILRKYPKNKLQRYGDKSIHSILRSENGYDVINPKTANEYIKRAKNIVHYAAKSKMVLTANVYEGELFNTNIAAEEQRLAYDNDDVIRLIDAICTQPLWRYNPPKPERFWIILIALFHGFRLGNIIGLTKRDICKTDKGTWIFVLRTGKTQATVRPVAICDSLLLLGFLEWIERLNREKLFQDTAASFSKFYNRVDRKADCTVYEGFEAKFVTNDQGKCLYSLRHSFAGNVFDVTEDFKITADMMGHSTGSSVTSRYTKLTKVDTLKEMTEKMHLEHIDLDKLEARAQELFQL